MSENQSKIGKEEFYKLLGEVTVQQQEKEDGLFEVSIDFSALSSFGQEDMRVLRFTLSPDQELEVSRPRGFVKVAGKKVIGYTSGPNRYRWSEGVPEPGKFTPPAARVKGRNARKERFNSMPVEVAVQALVHDNNLLGRDDKQMNKEIGRLWRELWRAIGPRLNAESLAIAHRFGLDWRHYVLLTKREDMRRLAEQAPGVGPRFREVNLRGRKLKGVISDLLGYTYQGKDEKGRHRSMNFGDFAGFQAWARNVPFGMHLLPLVRLPGETALFKDDSDPAWLLMRRIADMARDGQLDPNQIRKIESDTVWMALHTAAFRGGAWIAKAVLRDPEVTERNMERYFPVSKYGKALNKRVATAFRDIDKWKSSRWSAHYASKRWAEKLDDPSLEMEDSTKRISGFGRIARETAGWVKIQEWVAQKRRFGGRSDISGDGAYLLYASVEDVKRVIEHAEFRWSNDEIYYLLARPALRRDPMLRRVAAEKAESWEVIWELLSDSQGAEVRDLWIRLASRWSSPALDFLEKHEMKAEEGWKKEDIAALLAKGGEVALRAMPFVARFAEVEQEREASRLAEEEKMKAVAETVESSSPVEEVISQANAPVVKGAQIDLFGGGAALESRTRSRGRRR